MLMEVRTQSTGEAIATGYCKCHSNEGEPEAEPEDT